MPANLPPEYFEAEQRFKAAASPSEKVAALEALIATVPKHKGTDKLRADLRRRLSKLREDSAKRKTGARADYYNVSREGAAQIALVGFTNSGKSSVLAALTKAKPVVADYPVSTVLPLSGMMPFEDIQFQLVDLPPISNESTDGWVSGILRNADALLLVVDLTEDADIQAELLAERLLRWNIRKRAVMAANKADAPGTEEPLAALREKFGGTYRVIGISAKRREGFEELRDAVFKISGVIRVYSKEPGKEADLSQPFTLPEGSTVLDLAGIVHKDFQHGLKYASIWGSARFPGQKVAKEHVLKDRDIVELHA